MTLFAPKDLVNAHIQSQVALGELLKLEKEKSSKLSQKDLAKLINGIMILQSLDASPNQTPQEFKENYQALLHALKIETESARKQLDPKVSRVLKSFDDVVKNIPDERPRPSSPSSRQR